ncbi:MAG TPA: hypothetical protein DEB09_01590 [Candidatus Magasanikbacteria bacterium]|nr:hypothetical protein [Candidatus Magasanikbacteria bacterium]
MPERVSEQFLREMPQEVRETIKELADIMAWCKNKIWKHDQEVLKLSEMVTELYTYIQNLSVDFENQANKLVAVAGDYNNIRDLYYRLLDKFDGLQDLMEDENNVARYKVGDFDIIVRKFERSKKCDLNKTISMDCWPTGADIEKLLSEIFDPTLSNIVNQLSKPTIVEVHVKFRQSSHRVGEGSVQISIEHSVGQDNPDNIFALEYFSDRTRKKKNCDMVSHFESECPTVSGGKKEEPNNLFSHVSRCTVRRHKHEDESIYENSIKMIMDGREIEKTKEIIRELLSFFVENPRNFS